MGMRRRSYVLDAIVPCSKFYNPDVVRAGVFRLFKPASFGPDIKVFQMGLP
jgi:hypothetical protein